MIGAQSLSQLTSVNIASLQSQLRECMIGFQRAGQSRRTDRTDSIVGQLKAGKRTIAVAQHRYEGRHVIGLHLAVTDIDFEGAQRLVDGQRVDQRTQDGATDDVAAQIEEGQGLVAAQSGRVSTSLCKSCSSSNTCSTPSSVSACGSHRASTSALCPRSVR